MFDRLLNDIEWFVKGWWFLYIIIPLLAFILSEIIRRFKTGHR